MASTPKLASCSQTPSDYFGVPVGSEVYIFIVKNPKGNPWKEIEFFTQTALLASQLGTIFFDLVPIRMQVFDETFRLQSGVNLSGDTIRFYWNISGSFLMRQMEYDVVTNDVSSSPVNLPFPGRDPFIIDARTGTKPNRLYLAYVSAEGAQRFRISDDLGLTWGIERTADPASALVRSVEGALVNPLAEKNFVQVAQKRDP